MSPKLLPAQLLLLLGLLLHAAPALAKPEFPAVLTSELQLSYEPPCSVCHLTNKTSGVTVTTRFGYALRERGFTDRESLPLALTRLADDQADSDGDGVADVVELANATDPNSKANASLIDVADPSFGCSTAPSSSPLGALVSLLAVAAAALALRRRSQAIAVEPTALPRAVRASRAARRP